MKKFDVSYRNLGIVIVDDSRDLLRVYEQEFKEAGLNVVAKFLSAKEVLDYFTSGKKSMPETIILLDHRMPDMDGLETAMRIKELNRDQKIILTVSNVNVEFKVDERFFDGMVIKPFTIPDLIQEIERVTSPIRIKGSTIFTDQEEIERLLKDVLSDSKYSLCAVLSPKLVHEQARLEHRVPTYLSAISKGLKVMVVTEITIENLALCKQMMMNRGVELRHEENILPNFVVWDGKHEVEITKVLPATVSYSNLESIVREKQYLFEHHWNKAQPAETKIPELEKAISSEKKKATLVRGEEAYAAIIALWNNAKGSVDGCSLVDNPLAKLYPIIQDAWSEAVKRGVHTRIITDITKENLEMFKKSVHVEARHLPSVNAGFLLNESEVLVITSRVDSIEGLQYLHSDSDTVVEQYRSIFNTLWRIAIPVSERAKAIEQESKTHTETSINS